MKTMFISFSSCSKFVLVQKQRCENMIKMFGEIVTAKIEKKEITSTVVNFLKYG